MWMAVGLLSLWLGVAHAEPAAEAACLGVGVWTPSGQWGPHPDGCNRGKCEAGRWTAVTALDCRVQIAEVLCFPSEASAVVPAQAERLDAIAAALVSDPELGRFLIEGHSTPAEDAALADARASAVRDALVMRGVPAERLEVVGLGATSPAVASSAPDADARNRRVGFRRLPKDPCLPLPQAGEACGAVTLCAVSSNEYLTCSGGQWRLVREEGGLDD